MSDIVPAAIERLPAEVLPRLVVVQQARDEDLARVQRPPMRVRRRTPRSQPFFKDLPQRIADAHLVISRSGASTVAELAVIGRPSILVPLPGALDQDQAANAARARRRSAPRPSSRKPSSRPSASPPRSWRGSPSP